MHVRHFVLKHKIKLCCLNGSLLNPLVWVFLHPPHPTTRGPVFKACGKSRHFTWWGGVTGLTIRSQIRGFPPPSCSGGSCASVRLRFPCLRFRFQGSSRQNAALCEWHYTVACVKQRLGNTCKSRSLYQLFLKLSSNRVLSSSVELLGCSLPSNTSSHWWAAHSSCVEMSPCPRELRWAPTETKPGEWERLDAWVFLLSCPIKEKGSFSCC